MIAFPDTTTRRALVFLLSLALLGTSACAHAEVSAQLAAATPKPHPRLLLLGGEENDLKERLAQDPHWSAVGEFLLTRCDALLDAPPVTREKIGKRLLHVSRRALERVGYLALGYRLTGDARYLQRAEAEMLAAAAFEDWNPSHFLDVAEMTAALAIGYDWLYTDLRPEARDTIRAAIIENGLKTSLGSSGWITTENNWNQVCHGGLTLGALAVWEDAPELAQEIIARAVVNVPRAMAEYEPDGVYPEGPSYWQYGTTYNILLIAALESALGSDYGLSAHHGFMQSPEFYLHAMGNTGMQYNFSDCGLWPEPAAAMHWFAKRRGDPSLLWMEQRAFARFEQKLGEAESEASRMLPYLLIWGQSLDDLPQPATTAWQGDGTTSVAMMRSGWSETDTYLAIKGGSPSANHAHIDAGSFILEMDGVRWAIDLGMQDYHSLESRGIDLWNRSQNSQRWDVFRIGPTAHSILMFDGQPQRVRGNAPITTFEHNDAGARAVVDLAPVYTGQIAAATRTARLVDRGATLEDSITAAAQPVQVRWAMITNAAVTLDPAQPHTAHLAQAGKFARLVAPEDAVLQVVDLETPPHDYDSPNPNTRMIMFETALAASAQKTLSVHIRLENAAYQP